MVLLSFVIITVKCSVFSVYCLLFTIYHTNISYHDETVYRCSGVQAPGDQVSQFGCKSYQYPGVSASEQFWEPIVWNDVKRPSSVIFWCPIKRGYHITHALTYTHTSTHTQTRKLAFDELACVLKVFVKLPLQVSFLTEYL